MRALCNAALAAISILSATVVHAGVRITLPAVTVGRNLEAAANLELTEPATGPLLVTITSSDPLRMLLSTTPDKSGVKSIQVTIHVHSRFSSEFFVHGLGSSGTVTYTASAAGMESVAGTVTLAPSAIVFAGGSGIPLSSLLTTRGTRAGIGLYSALLDASRNFVAIQPVAGGRSVEVDIASSDQAVGHASPRKVKIGGGNANATIEFQPGTPGMTTLSASASEGFTFAA